MTASDGLACAIACIGMLAVGIAAIILEAEASYGHMSRARFRVGVPILATAAMAAATIATLIWSAHDAERTRRETQWVHEKLVAPGPAPSSGETAIVIDADQPAPCVSDFPGGLHVRTMAELNIKLRGLDGGWGRLCPGEAIYVGEARCAHCDGGTVAK